jgi:hypothetical protein
LLQLIKTLLPETDLILSLAVRIERTLWKLLFPQRINFLDNARQNLERKERHSPVDVFATGWTAETKCFESLHKQAVFPSEASRPIPERPSEWTSVAKRPGRGTDHGPSSTA